MNKTAISTAIALGLALAALTPLTAGAASGTINFTGQVTDQTCAIGFDTGNSINVALPTVPSSALAASGQVAGATPFNITLTGCSAALTTAQTFFEPGPNVNYNTGNLNLTSGGATAAATNVQIQLLNASRSPMNLANPQGQQNSQVVSISTAGTTTLSYFAQYIAVGGAAAAGSANSSVTFTMIYK